MNNTMCLAIFMALVYFKNLEWIYGAGNNVTFCHFYDFERFVMSKNILFRSTENQHVLLSIKKFQICAAFKW